MQKKKKEDNKEFVLKYIIIMIIIIINQLSKNRQIWYTKYMNTFLRKMEACVLNIVATTLDIHSPLFSRVDCVSKQFRLSLWRVKYALEPWIKSQTKTYNVLKMRLQILFQERKSPDNPLFQVGHFWCFDACESIMRLQIYHFDGF